MINSKILLISALSATMVVHMIPPVLPPRCFAAFEKIQNLCSNDMKVLMDTPSEVAKCRPRKRLKMK